MADNALAPPSRNALAPQTSREMQALLRKTAAAPEYGSLVDYLAARRMMPPINFSGLTGGKFTHNGVVGNELPATGVVTVGRFVDPSTVVHELTHAADRQMRLQYSELKNKRGSLTPEEKRFMDAYEKLVETPMSFTQRGELKRVGMAAQLDPKWRDAEGSYRASQSELPAWGMASAVTPARTRDYGAPPHLDPTMASEFQILMDLARRAQPVIPGR